MFDVPVFSYSDFKLIFDTGDIVISVSYFKIKKKRIQLANNKTKAYRIQGCFFFNLSITENIHCDLKHCVIYS